MNNILFHSSVLLLSLRYSYPEDGSSKIFWNVSKRCHMAEGIFQGMSPTAYTLAVTRSLGHLQAYLTFA
jgi:hypothetical protein